MSVYPHGSFPGEIVGIHDHISKRIWWKLRHDPGFLTNWNSSKLDRPYHIAVACITRGLTHDQMMTVLRIWHWKHGHTFYEDDFINWVYPAASQYAVQFVFLHESNEYWNEIRRIAFDPRTRQHSKLRVAYFLMNTEQATARQISERTGIPLKTVRNSLLALQDSGKVQMNGFAAYKAVQSFHWDQAMSLPHLKAAMCVMRMFRRCTRGVRKATKGLAEKVVL